MTRKNLRIFLDTSVIFAAVLSPTGGAHKLFLLAEAGVLTLVVGPTVLREAEEAIRRKAPRALSMLAQLLVTSNVETSSMPSQTHLRNAQSYVRYGPDAKVLAEAICANPDWFVTHDKEHFLKTRPKFQLTFEVGTPGDVLQRYKDDFSLL